MTTGWRDMAALGIAVVGLVAVGPIQLFFPTYAAARFSGWVWGMLLALYLLSLFLVVLSCRPRFIVYGLDEESFFQSLLTAATRIDAGAAWHGQILSMPTVGLQLAFEPTGSRGVQQAVSVTGLESITAWSQLERELVDVCGESLSTSRGSAGWWLLVAGASLIAIAISLVAQDPAQALNDLRDFFVR